MVDMYPEVLAEPRSISRIVIPEGAEEVCGHDIALLVVEGEGFAADEAAPIVPRLEQGASGGEAYAAIGYGTDGDTYGTRRLSEKLVVGCVGAECSSRIVEGEFFGGGALCDGDSGGPALDGEGRVFAVASRGNSECTESVYTAVAAYSEWIRLGALEAAQKAGSTAPPWAGVAGSPGDDVSAAGAGGSSSGAAGAGGEPGAAAGTSSEYPLDTRSEGGCAVAPQGGSKHPGLGISVFVLGWAGRRRRRCWSGWRRASD
jgi:MYXO-CTERM domain-containing protein